jgi:hypothetical protein
MFHRGRAVRRITMLTAILLLVGPVALAQQHTWTNVERVIAVGDIHGDGERLEAILLEAKVIDKDRNWIADKAHLVQVGDLFGRGPNSRGAMDLLIKLEKQAEKAGGRVHVLIGNHEAMVLGGDWHYIPDEEIEAFGGRKAFAAAVGPEGRYGRWIRGLNAVVKINNLLFLHGGLDAKHGAMSLDDLNNGVRKHLAGKADGNRLASNPRGPLWYRGNAFSSGEALERDWAAISKTHGVNHIVIGHTISMGRIKPRAGGRVLMIDIGISSYYDKYGGAAGCLVVDKGEFRAVYVGGKSHQFTIPTTRQNKKGAE